MPEPIHHLASAGVLGVLLGAVGLALYWRWQWQPRVLYGMDGRGIVHRDIAGRPQIERDLIVDTVVALPVGVFVTDAKMRAVWMNPAAEAAVGWTLAALRKRGSYRDLIDEHDIDAADAAIEENEDRDMMQVEHRNRWHAADGTRRHLVWTATPFDVHGYARCTVRLTDIEAMP